jgi:ribosomal protein S18 acetylase RimI-like enzyme
MHVYELTKDAKDDIINNLAELYMQQISVGKNEKTFKLAVQGIRLSLEDHSPARIVIAEDGNEILGFAFLNVGVSLRTGGHYLWLNELYVHNQYRNKGIGRKLLLYVIHMAERENIKTIELETGVNNSITKHIYQSLGFYEIVSKRYGFSF